MEQITNYFKERNWPIAVLSIVSAILGIIAGPVIEAINPPLFQGQNLQLIAFLFSGFLFIVIGVFATTFWNRSINESKKKKKKLAAIVHKLDVKFQYVGIGKGSTKASFTEAANLIKNANNEILILNYGPVQKIEGKYEYDREATASEERKQYYQTINTKILKSKSGKFKFRRILQMPKTQEFTDLFDPLMAEHLKILAEIGTKTPEFACVKRSLPFFNDTLMIIDRRYVLFSISALDPDDLEYYTKGHFIFDDPIGTFANEFVRFFERVDSHSTLIKTSDLPTLKLSGKDS